MWNRWEISSSAKAHFYTVNKNSQLWFRAIVRARCAAFTAGKWASFITPVGRRTVLELLSLFSVGGSVCCDERESGAYLPHAAPRRSSTNDSPSVELFFFTSRFKIKPLWDSKTFQCSDFTEVPGFCWEKRPASGWQCECWISPRYRGPFIYTSPSVPVQLRICKVQLVEWVSL